MEYKDKKTMGVGFIIALIFISLLITGLIIIAFLFSENRFVITKAIITLLCLLVIIVLSCRFDEIHFGHLFEVSRKANVEIQQITSEEIEEQIKQDEIEERTYIHLKRDKFYNILLEKYFGSEKYNKLQKDIGIVETSTNHDPISNRKVYFLAYLKDQESEKFIEIDPSQSLLYHDRIYVKLNKILSYNEANKLKSKLLLLIPTETNSEENTRNEFFKKYFTPAINSNLLQIEKVVYTKNEYDSCIEEKTIKNTRNNIKNKK